LRWQLCLSAARAIGVAHGESTYQRQAFDVDCLRPITSRLHGRRRRQGSGRSNSGQGPPNGQDAQAAARRRRVCQGRHCITPRRRPHLGSSPGVAGVAGEGAALKQRWPEAGASVRGVPRTRWVAAAPPVLGTHPTPPRHRLPRYRSSSLLLVTDGQHTAAFGVRRTWNSPGPWLGLKCGCGAAIAAGWPCGTLRPAARPLDPVPP